MMLKLDAWILLNGPLDRCIEKQRDRKQHSAPDRFFWEIIVCLRARVLRVEICISYKPRMGNGEIGFVCRSSRRICCRIIIAIFVTTWTDSERNRIHSSSSWMRPNSSTSLTPFLPIFRRHLIVSIHILSDGNCWRVRNQRTGSPAMFWRTSSPGHCENCQSSWAWRTENLFSINRTGRINRTLPILRPFAILRVRRHTRYDISDAIYVTLCETMK